MKTILADAVTGEVIAPDAPEGTKSVQTVQPRIRCRDCKRKVYNPGPGETVENFEKHLKIPSHRANANARVGKPTAPQDIAREEAAGKASRP